MHNKNTHHYFSIKTVKYLFVLPIYFDHLVVNIVMIPIQIYLTTTSVKILLEILIMK